MKTTNRVAVAVGALIPALGLLTAAPAAAVPAFQVPFTCGVTVTAATYAGHNPPYSVDFQKSGISGMPVLASASGRVSRVANEGDTSYGRWIELDHGSGWTTRYAHLSAQNVTVGTQVALGRQIGKAGDTGGSTGPHLHYEQRSGGTAVKAKLAGTAVPYYGKTPFTSKNSC